MSEPPGPRRKIIKYSADNAGVHYGLECGHVVHARDLPRSRLPSADEGTPQYLPCARCLETN